MPNLHTKTNLNTALALTMLASLFGTNAQAADFRYAKGVKPTELRLNGQKVSQQKFEAGMSRQIRKLKRDGVSKKAGFDLTSINVVDDCSASVTCGNGEVIECSITGPGSCESGFQSVACFTSNHAEADQCDPPSN